jgi:diguanylate cyclase (GGDEF)-like protein/PAS domain S-box-containing protein
MTSPATILIVDDEAQNCRLLEVLLRPEGYVTLTAASGEEALALVAAQSPDLILLDIMMPGMDGYQVAAALKSNLITSNIPIIMVTALIDRNARMSGLDAGAEEFLTKPVDRAELWLRVRNLLRLKEYSDFLQNHSEILNQQVQLRTAELQRFRSAMDAAADAITLVSRSTMRFVEVNATACAMFGYTREEFFGMSPGTIIGLTSEELENTYDALIAGREMKEAVEHQLRRKDGSSFPAEIHRHVQRSADDWIIVGVVRDITERKLAAQKLRASEEQFRQMAENIRDIFYLVDAITNRVLYVSPAYEQVSGRSCDGLLANPELWTATIHPDDRPAAEAAIRQAMPGGKFEIEYRMLRPDGSIRWIESRGFPVRDAAGRTIRVAGVAKDITEFRLATQELRASESRFSDMLGSVELASVMLDPEGRITYCNDYLLRLTGWEREEVLGGDWFKLFAAPTADVASGFFAALLVGQPHAWARENEIVTRSGQRRRMLWSNSLLHSGAGELIGTASIGEDITERKEAEARIAYLNRVYAVLSGINTLIVRVSDRGELFAEACRIAVETGGFRMALIGLVEPRAMQVVPVASSGMDGELLAAIKALLSSGKDASRSMIARAVRDKSVVVSNASLTDPKVLLGTLHAAFGVRSLAVLPLIVDGEALGVLALYSGEIEFFHDEEMELLAELAGDISFALDHIEKQERLDYLAYYDVLTGLANRSLFLERVAQYMRSAVAGGHRLALFLVDLERFKNINDSLGQPAGDALLKQVAEWLTRYAGDASLTARLGADHFALVMPQVRDDGDLAKLLETTIAAFLEHPFRLNDAVFRVAAKVGVALFPDNGSDADTLLKNAEAALKQAKAGGDRHAFYAENMTTRAAGTFTLENQLRQALDRDEFVLHYQPKVNLESGKVTGAEALIRWNDPRTGLVPPGRFIPVLEETGLIYEVGRWAMRKVIEDYLRWRKAGLTPVRIAVNVSPLQLRNRSFVEEVRRKIGIDTNAAAGLELEITESLIMEDVKHNIASLNAIREMGVGIAIDDFGTGFSSLSYLARLPVDTLKIDRSFVTDMTLSPEGLALVSTIVNLAHALKLKVVAEGVETDEQAHLLRLLNCDEMQGYLFCKPVPGEIFEARFLLPNEITRQGGEYIPQAPTPLHSVGSA